MQNGGEGEGLGFLTMWTLSDYIQYSHYASVFIVHLHVCISILCVNETIVPTMKAIVAIIQYEPIAAYFSLGDFANHILATFYT